MTREQLEAFSRRLTDEGKLIEAGWIGLRLASIPEDEPELQLDEMRNAFFAGAQHLFSSIMTILEPDAEPTEKDLKRLSLIDAELGLFLKGFVASHIPTKGNA